jgi:hypothetical protein
MPASGRNRGRRLGSQFSGLAGVEAGAPAADLPPFPDFVRRGAGAVERGRSRNALLGVPACPASVEARRHNSDHSPSRGPTPAPDRAHDTCRTRRLGRRGARGGEPTPICWRGPGMALEGGNPTIPICASAVACAPISVPQRPAGNRAGPPARGALVIDPERSPDRGRRADEAPTSDGQTGLGTPASMPV